MHRFRFVVVCIALLLLHPVLAIRRSGIIVEPQPESHTARADSRKLQQTAFNYRANYTADFLHLADPSCTGNAPTLVVTCLKAQNMTILGTSSDSIQCIAVDFDFVGYEDALSYQCSNTCSGTSCNDVYKSTVIEGPYGSIQFMCEGDDYQQVEGAYVFIGGADGSCTTSNATSTRNLHIARLGLSCPSDSGSDVARHYVYDDTYFECRFSGNNAALSSTFDSVGDPSDTYSCLTGEDCFGMACSGVLFSNILIRSAVPEFLVPCIETTLQSITAIPTQSPIVPAVTDTIYNVRFEALWGNLYDSETGLMTCQLENTGLLISCGNGATAIRFHNSSDSSMNCTNVNDIDLHCVGDEARLKSQFTSVFYDCFGGNVSTSRVTFPETNASCDKNNMDVVLRNSVIMGLACPGEPMFYSDVLFECMDPNHEFFVSSGQFNLQGDRFICSESTNIKNGSSVSDVQIIPSVSMTTDSLWLIDPIRVQCSTIVEDIPPIPTLIPTAAPSESNSIPTSIVPIGVPTPTKSAFIMPVGTTSTPAAIAGVPIVPTSDRSETTNTNSGTIFAVIGGIVGGIVVSLIVFYVYRKGKNDGIAKKYYNNETGSHSHGSTDQLTQGNSDHLTRASGSTNKRSSSSAVTTSQSGTSASDVRSPRTPTTTEAVNATNAYVIDYKDQARSVDHRFPVSNSARRVATGDMPIAMAVAVTDITDDYKSSIFSKQTPSDVATRFDV